MTTGQFPQPGIDSTIIGEVADWLVLFQSGNATDEDREMFARWLEQSPSHGVAWKRAEDILGSFKQVPPKIGHGTMERLGKPRRRQVLQALGLLFIASPIALLAYRQVPWQELSADLHTGTGEQKTVDLGDGTRLVLNTASAVDIIFTADERRLKLLAGEILVTTGRDPSPTYRPFIIQTAEGSLRALGTRFAVRRTDASTQVAVFEGAVEVKPANNADATILHANEQLIFTAGEMQVVRPVEASAALWEKGMLVAKDMRLGDLVHELDRYRRGILRCDPAVADMLVSGAFPLRDTQASLSLLQKTMPLRINSITSYWVTIQPL